MNKRTLTLLLAAFSALPLAAQVNKGDNNHQTRTGNTPLVSSVAQQGGQNSAHLNTSLTRAVTAAVEQAKTCPHRYTEVELSPGELITAEEELSLLRSRVDSNATFTKYPYLLDPSYRHTHNASGELLKQPAVTVTQPVPLSTQEQIEAEEELSLLRNRIDPHATFDSYPYLLDPAYRRADDNKKQSIRRRYIQTTWANKVGL